MNSTKKQRPLGWADHACYWNKAFAYVVVAAHPRTPDLNVNFKQGSYSSSEES